MKKFLSIFTSGGAVRGNLGGLPARLFRRGTYSGPLGNASVFDTTDRRGRTVFRNELGRIRSPNAPADTGRGRRGVAGAVARGEMSRSAANRIVRQQRSIGGAGGGRRVGQRVR